MAFGMFPLFSVFVGGGIGATLRYLTGMAALRLIGPGYPYGTLAANLIGGLAMGMLAGVLARAAHGGEHWRLFIGVGILGGYTTFSSFSLEVMLMLQRGEWLTGFGYIALSVVGAITALGAGLAVVRVLA